MQAETALGRVGLWFLVMLAAMAAALGAFLFAKPRESALPQTVTTSGAEAKREPV